MAASRCAAIVPAAGSGTRLGAAMPKALVEVCGKPMILRTVEQLVNSALFDLILVCAPQEHLVQFQELFHSNEKIVVLSGGATRQESVKAALDHLGGISQPVEYVCVHDAARPLVTIDLLKRVVDAARASGAATAAVPIYDSLRVGSLSENLSQSREGFWAVQTPQAFSCSLLTRAHSEDFIGATDDASLVERIAPVMIVEGEGSNLKVTTQNDLRLAQALIQQSSVN